MRRLWPWLLMLGLVCPWTLHAAIVEPAQAVVTKPDGTAGIVALPMSARASGLREGRLRASVAFNWPADQLEARPLAVYLPHLYDGGRVWLDGQLLGEVPESDAQRRVRWRLPHLIPVPAGLLSPGPHELVVDVPIPAGQPDAYVPRPVIGPLDQLQPRAQWRAFWVRGIVEATLMTCLLLAAGTLLLWWLRRSEVLYGLFGLACLVWALRMLTFVVDEVPTAWWPVWRAFQWFTLVGAAASIAWFSLRWAGLRLPWLERTMGGTVVLATGLAALADEPWQRGLAQAFGVFSIVGIGGVALGAAVWAARRRREAAARVVLMAWIALLAAAAHDYLMFWHADWMYRWWPGWTEQGHLLLRHAVGVLLVTFGVMLLQRFVQTLDGLEVLNRTLERRVAERERALRESLARMTELERQRAVHEERERIVRELHDGLGSQLFVALSRSQRALLTPAEMTQRLRDCVAELRLALDICGAPDGDLAAAWGDLRFRWVQQLTQAGLEVQWHTAGLDRPLTLPASAMLQVLRITQEALTNVLRHARARQVWVGLRAQEASLEVVVEDDGVGFEAVEGPDHRGLRNMRARAQQIGARLEIVARPGGGTAVRLAWTMPRAD